jgi:hypothetical protein
LLVGLVAGTAVFREKFLRSLESRCRHEDVDAARRRALESRTKDPNDVVPADRGVDAGGVQASEAQLTSFVQESMSEICAHRVNGTNKEHGSAADRYRFGHTTP